ncbi:hypothetical protein SDC9_140890 [bioreactor metagenome]|uniref:RNase H type-1 domain-containing protein n=1 Tax=bioreactor metagenome TaxID=1076179 RepID=A0A645DX89_9ZZZZ
MESQHNWTVFIDGSAVPNPGRMRIGGVAYPASGASAIWFSRGLNGVGCNNEAEALAAIHALQWIRDEQQATHLVLCTDNSILAEQLRLPHPKRIERLASLYDKARTLLSLFESVEVRWIPRHRNAVADALARGDWEAAGVPAQ